LLTTIAAEASDKYFVCVSSEQLEPQRRKAMRLAKDEYWRATGEVVWSIGKINSHLTVVVDRGAVA
jgi:hypothetical protein